MPVHSFLSSIADKAQSAMSHLPASAHLPGSPDSTTQPTANAAAAQPAGSYKSHAFESLQHQLRTFGQQYSSATTPVQKIITAEKGVAIDYDSVSQDSKAQSKELYTWGQLETEDLKDVTDRLAYLNFVQGSLASTLAAKLDTARTPLKALRDAETALLPRRNQRANLQNQISRLEHELQRPGDRRMVELRDQLSKAELEDLQQEKEIDLLKRKAVRESEIAKWEAIREYGEKLALLSQAAAPIIAVLPTVPPTPTNPYRGAQATGAVRASLQRALDNYKTGHINLTQHPSDLDTRSFGESHASELSSIPSQPAPISAHPASSHSPTIIPGSAQVPQPTYPTPTILPSPPGPLPSSPPPVNTPRPSGTHLGQYPQPHQIPLPNVGTTVPPVVNPTTAPPASSPTPSSTGGFTPIPVPTTGNTANTPASGSSTAPKVQSPDPAGQATPNFPETSKVPVHETAEEEKRRLEREERERLLRGEGQQGPSYPADKKDNKDDELPPVYSE